MGLLSAFTDLFKKRKVEDKSYLALALLPERVLAAIWEFDNDQIRVLGTAERSFQHTNVLIHQSAIAIDKAGKQAGVDISKVVFGVSHFWIENGELNPETSKILKQLSKDLDLDPQAYIPLASSIGHFLKIEEEVSPNLILVGMHSNFCEVHLIENNQVLKTKISQSPSTVPKVIELIKQLKSEDKDLPAKIVVFGFQEEQKAQEKFKDINWQNLFIHEPKIKVLGDSDLSKSVAYAQAADILGYEPNIIPNIINSKREGATAEPKLEKDNQKGDEFGFVEGEDILISQQPPTPSKTEDYAVEIDQQLPSGVEDHHQPHELRKKKGFLPLHLFSRFRDKITDSSFIKKVGIGAAFLIVSLIVAAFVLGKTITSAEIIIKANSKSIDQSFKADVVLKNPNDTESSIIGKEITTKESGSQKAVATGTKKQGEYAKGKVKVFNWTISQISFPQDTIIVSKNGVKFTIDSEVQIASRSASTPGESATNVTAKEFGDKGNLSEGTDFTFQEFDELLYSAKNDEVFTGGDEKEITVVSKEDLDKLEKSLKTSLSEKAKKELMAKAGEDKLTDDAISIEVLSSKPDKAVDQEASLVNLDMEVEASAIIYSEGDLKKQLASDIKGDVPDGFQVRAEDIDILETRILQKKDTLSLSGKFKADLVPQFNEEELKEKIGGKSIKDTRAIIKEIPDVSDVDVKFSPNLPLTSSIPKNKSKIKFTIQT